MKNAALTLQPLWINHIERFSERMRPRLYGALIAFLLHGTPIPEKLLPYLGIILDLIEAETGVAPETSETSDSPELPDVAVILPVPAAGGHEYLPASAGGVDCRELDRLSDTTSRTTSVRPETPLSIMNLT
ncbi:MAG: hypothetical protein K2M19_04335 [Muribaculaceae bacterium]|nr:hypothetical protein [Muribaculaceae bacterium]